MRINVKTENRKSIAYYLAPEELTIVLPENGDPTNVLESPQLMIQNPNIVFNPNGPISRGEFREILNLWASKLDVKPKKVQVRNIRNKWASCSASRNIIFNESLQNMPKEFVEYVICHELLHLKVQRHNKLFRSLLSAYMPDWQNRLTKTVENIIGHGI